MSVELVQWVDLEQKLQNWDEAQGICLALVDIDRFQQINDQYGADVGDAVLEEVQQALLKALAEGYLARYGGDEFALLLTNLSPEEALLKLEPLRLQIGQTRRYAQASLEVGLSMGLAAFPQHATDPSHLLQAADAALLRAKHHGRGRIAMYVEEKMVLKSNYYPKAQLSRLATLAERTQRSEAALLREALAALLDKHRELF